MRCKLELSVNRFDSTEIVVLGEEFVEERAGNQESAENRAD